MYVCTYVRTYVHVTYLYTRSRDALVGFMFINSNATNRLPTQMYLATNSNMTWCPNKCT